jgi:hypothetical protein
VKLKFTCPLTLEAYAVIKGKKNAKFNIGQAVKT